MASVRARLGVTTAFDGQRVLVTGAAQGIGRAIARHFAAQGASVFAADLDLAGAEATA